jgi:8-oxo-dGTP diphosphatase
MPIAEDHVDGSRRAARAILLDDAGCVLLIRFAVVRDGNNFAFWATPGGTVEPGETDFEAIKREVREELAVELQLSGPVHSSVQRFTHKGAPVENTDIFFVGRFNQKEPHLHATTDEERSAMKETRWWSSKELDETAETIFPEELAILVRRFG